MIIPVSTNTHGYDIVLESGALNRIGELIDLDRQVLIVTDDGVPAAYSRKVAANCPRPTLFTLPQGEASKNLDSFRALLTSMMNAGFTRGDCVVAVGGGVVGDLSGFAAACYMRGIEFYNVPTTLLSQVDSSIGGKTAVDLNGTKNIVGAFYPPWKVIIDPETLLTLPERQKRAGLAEVIKMAATSDPALFALLESSTDLQGDLPEIIRRSLLIKKGVVEQDPTEKGLRRVLNFGHTIGHAVESAEEGRLLHGECVALGMLPMAEAPARARLAALTRRYGLPTAIAQRPAELLPFLLRDKKKQASTITAVLVDQIGSFRFEKLLPSEILARLENEI